jgi:hypothetical protein
MCLDVLLMRPFRAPFQKFLQTWYFLFTLFVPDEPAWDLGRLDQAGAG